MKTSFVQRLKLILCIIFSCIVFSLAIPNEIFTFGNPFFGVIALIPAFYAVANSPNYKFTLILGFIWGLLANALGSYWLFFFKDYAFWTIGLTSITYGIFYAFYFGWMDFFYKKSGRFRILFLASSWMAIEFAKSIGFLAYPWALISYSFNEVLPFIQIVDQYGVFILSFVLAYVNAVLFEVLNYLGRRRNLKQETILRNAIFIIIMIGGIFTYGFVSINTAIPKSASFNALLVQANKDSWAGTERDNLVTAQQLTRKAIFENAEKPDLVVFSETILRRPYIEYKEFFKTNFADDPFIPFLKDIDTPLLIGGPTINSWEPIDFSNSVYLLNPDSSVSDTYSKSHLVPFAEVIPFWEYEWMRSLMKTLVGLEGGWTPGKTLTNFTITTKDGKITFGAPICFEDAFSDKCRDMILNGSDLLINVTNDGWSKTKSAEIQHFVAARFRAIELRRTLVRSTNSGFTCVVDPYGKILDSLPLFTEGSLFIKVPVYKNPTFTPYTLFADWISWLNFFFLVLSFIIIKFKSLKAFTSLKKGRV